MLEAAIKVNFTVILSQIVEGFAFERHNFFFFFSLWDVYILMYWFFLICLWHKFLCFKVDEYLFVAEEFQKRIQLPPNFDLIEGAVHMPQEDW